MGVDSLLSLYMYVQHKIGYIQFNQPTFHCSVTIIFILAYFVCQLYTAM